MKFDCHKRFGEAKMFSGILSLLNSNSLKPRALIAIIITKCGVQINHGRQKRPICKCMLKKSNLDNCNVSFFSVRILAF